MLNNGELFAERYLIQERVGEGGMGAVYLVLDTMLDNECIALKVLHPELSRDERYATRFLREARIARRINHPNVIRTFDVGTAGSALFFTMEYVPGKTLREILSGGFFNPFDTATILAQVCRGLEAVHKQEIVHRDLNPANILIPDDNIVKIMDFGVARPPESNLTAHHEVVGSSHYISPEGWVGDQVSPRSDLYSLGIVAYEMLTGIKPFDADSHAELMYKHIDGHITHPSELVQGMPLWLEQLVLQMLAKRPEERPASAAEVAQLLEQKLQDQRAWPAAAVPDAAWEETAPLAEQIAAVPCSEPAPLELESDAVNAAPAEHVPPARTEPTTPASKTTQTAGQLPAQSAPVTPLPSSVAVVVPSAGSLLQCLTVSIVIAFLLCYPINYIVKIVTTEHLNLIVSPGRAGLSLLVILLYLTLLAAFPIIPFAALTLPLPRILLRWVVLAGSTLGFTLIYVAALASWAVLFMLSLGGQQLFSNLHFYLPQFTEAAGRNILEILLLSPSGTPYAAFFGMGHFEFIKAESSLVSEALYYPLLLVFFITLYFHISRGLKLRLPSLTGRLLSLSVLTLLVVLEISLAAPLEEAVPALALDKYFLQLGPYQYSIQRYKLLCGIVNWIYVFLVFGLLPLLFKPDEHPVGIKIETTKTA